jgi:hypothetical protein
MINIIHSFFNNDLFGFLVYFQNNFSIIISYLGNFIKFSINYLYFLENYFFLSFHIVSIGILILFFESFFLDKSSYIKLSGKKIGEKVIQTIGVAGGLAGIYSGGKEIYKDVTEGLKNKPDNGSGSSKDTGSNDNVKQDEKKVSNK